jgi:hypothetical protein
MLIAVDPLLQRIDALPEPGCYSVTFLLAGNHERSVVMKVPADADAARDVIVPEANMLPGWSPASASFVAVLAAVLAVDRARSGTDSADEALRDVPGGWDVGIGNIVLDELGRPNCVAHGELEQVETGHYVCATCQAQALFGPAGSS